MKGYEHLRYSLEHLSSEALRQQLTKLVERDRGTTAWLLAHIAEFDHRRLYRREAYPSMFRYCVGALHFSESAAYKRIHAARAVRRYPAFFVAVAEGKVHLTAITLLRPHLTPGNCEALLAASTHKSKFEVERMLAERFPKPDLPTTLRALPSPPPGNRVPSPAMHGHVPAASLPGAHLAEQEPELAPERVRQVPAQVSVPEKPAVPSSSRVTPLAPERFALQVTLARDTHDKLRRAQELLGHTSAAFDLAQVLDRALDALVTQLEKRKFAAHSKPRPHATTPRNPRAIPAAVRRAVYSRDAGQCTFVSEHGRRCEPRAALEFDHVEPFARGGGSTLENLRLRCRAHNQMEAERAFGAEFMREKRPAAP